MRYLVISDIHGNLPALEAVLATPEAAACQVILSLGDQVNYGPQSREVLLRLKALGARMLLGNHEERLQRLRDPRLAGYNWALLHWTARQLTGPDTAAILRALPRELRLDGLLCTHAAPGDLYRLLHPRDVPAVLDQLPDGVTTLLTGHHHIAWHIRHGGRTAVNPGSVGVTEGGVGGVAPFAVLDGGAVTLHRARYNPDDVARAYLSSGCALAAPEMCRIILQNLRTGRYDSVSSLVRHVAAAGDPADPTVWRAADLTYPWDEPLSTPEFWEAQEERL